MCVWLVVDIWGMSDTLPFGLGDFDFLVGNDGMPGG